MKILLVHNYYRSGSPGGEDVVFEQERALLEGAGHEVVSYTRHNDEMQGGRIGDALKVLSGLQHSKRTQRELHELIARKRPQVAHFHNTFPLVSASGYTACATAGVPIVQTVHNYRAVCASANHFRSGAVCEACTAGRPWAAVRYGCYRNSRAASFAVARMIRANARPRSPRESIGRYLALTHFAARRLIEAGVPATRIVVKPNFVDLSRLPQGLAGAPEGASPYAVFSGRLSAEKGVETLIRAWAGVSGLSLKILGDGPERARLEARARAEGLPVEFLGMRPREEALQIVARARCQIVPSEWFEGMPMVALEAWALGVPLIAAKIGGLEEMLGEAERGLAFAPGDARALAACVARLQGDPALALRLIGNGRQALAAHRPEASLAILEDTYRSLIG